MSLYDHDVYPFKIKLCALSAHFESARFVAQSLKSPYILYYNMYVTVNVYNHGMCNKHLETSWYATSN